MNDAPSPPVAETVVGRRKVLLGLGLLATSGVALARQPVATNPRIETDALSGLIPDQIAGFSFNTESGLILPPSDALSDRLYDNLVTRTYTRPDGAIVMLLIAYNNRQDGVLQIHRPEVCYPAGGFQLTPTMPLQLPLTGPVPLEGQIFTASSDQRDEVVFYWTRIGSEFPKEWLDQRLAVAKANLSGIIPDGVLVRVSTLTRDRSVAEPLLASFVSDMFRRSPPELRRLLYDRT